MAHGEIRDRQLSSVIAEEIDIILASASDPRLSELQVVSVETKRGGGHYTVLLAPIEESPGWLLKDAETLLARAEKYIRFELAGALNLKRVPQVSLICDPRFFKS